MHGSIAMSFALRSNVYLLTIFGILLEKPVSSNANCTISNEEYSTWRIDNFPNPQSDIGLCGRNCKPSWICDPGHTITIAKGDELDALIDTVATSGKCTCPNCTSSDGFNISVAVVPYINITSNNVFTSVVQDFVSSLRLEWNYQKCDNDILIVLSTEQNQIYTDVGSNSEQILTAECIQEVKDKVQSSLSGGQFEKVLEDTIKQYKIILSVGDCDYISRDRSLTTISIAVGSGYGLAVLIFAACSIVRSRKGFGCTSISKSDNYRLNSYDAGSEENNPRYDMRDNGNEN